MCFIFAFVSCFTIKWFLTAVRQEVKIWREIHFQQVSCAVRFLYTSHIFFLNALFLNIKFKSRNGASVSEELAYLIYVQQCISGQPFIQSLSIFSKSFRYLKVELKASIMSAWFSRESDFMKSLSQQKRNTFATTGAHLVPIGIPKICL